MNHMKSDDLISRSAFDEVLDELEGLKAHAAFTEGIMVVRRELEQFPSVDAEPVIWCNICKHYEADTGYCYMHDHGMDWVDFCSRGKKIDAEVSE